MLNAKQMKEKESLELEMKQVTRVQSVLNENQVQKIFNSTPRKYKYKRPAKGGGEWTYVKASYVRRVLDSVFGFNWDFIRKTTDTELLGYLQLGLKQVVIHGEIIGRVKVDGQWIELRKSGTGRADIKYRKGSQDPLDFGNDIKAAESDAMKKAASRFGIAQDVYEADEFQEINIVGADDNSDRSKNKQRLIAEAEKELHAEGSQVED